MARYANTTVKQKNGVYSLKTTIYSSIPETDNDIYVITQLGDRLDMLAQQFYGTTDLWWYIAKANGLTDLRLPAGTSLRIPGDVENAIGF